MIQSAAMAVSERDSVGSEMPERSEDSGESVGDDGDQQLPHPWPYLKELFEIVGSKKASWKIFIKTLYFK